MHDLGVDGAACRDLLDINGEPILPVSHLLVRIDLVASFPHAVPYSVVAYRSDL